MFYFAVLEFVHFTIYEVYSAHTPNRNAVCVCVCWNGRTYVCSMQIRLYIHLRFYVHTYVCVFLWWVASLCVYVSEKAPENSYVSH